MLDNVSTDDFNDADPAAAAVQQQVEEALNTKDVQSVLNSSSTSGTFMASPSAAPSAVIASTSDPITPTASPASDLTSEELAQDTMNDSPAAESPVVSDVSVPHPLTPEENAEIESHPSITSVSSPAANAENTEQASTTDQSASAPMAPPELPSAESTVVPAPALTDLATEEVAEPELPAQPQDEAHESTFSDDLTAEVSTKVTEESVEASVETVPKQDTDSASLSEPDSAPAIDTDKLAGMKQQALEHLEPLVDHLDQTPEEEFRTTMMRIQANDNHTLLERAFEAAKRITDDKERAQAMLDIVNEINYFSQSSK